MLSKQQVIEDAVNAFCCFDHELIGQIEGAFYRIKYYINSEGVHLVLVEGLNGDIIDVVEFNSPLT